MVREIKRLALTLSPSPEGRGTHVDSYGIRGVDAAALKGERRASYNVLSGGITLYWLTELTGCGRHFARSNSKNPSDWRRALTCQTTDMASGHCRLKMTKMPC